MVVNRGKFTIIEGLLFIEGTIGVLVKGLGSSGVQVLLNVPGLVSGGLCSGHPVIFCLKSYCLHIRSNLVSILSYTCIILLRC